MKRTLFLASSLLALLLMAACQKGDSAVTISVKIPDSPQTKAIAQAEKVDIVYYEVWNADWSKQYFPSDNSALASAPVSGGRATIDLVLVKGQTYNLIFWACNEASDAYDVNSLQKVEVDYAVMAENGNSDYYDAFYSVNTITVTGSFNETIVLRRPFAQLNFGASKMATSFGDIVLDKSEVTVSELATVFDTRNGVGVVPAGAPVTFKANSIATTEMLQTNGQSYAWITMDYMLMMDEQDAVEVDASFVLKDNNSPIVHKVHNVPLRKNYRTNIVGDLFTSNASLKVIVDPAFVDDYEINITK